MRLQRGMPLYELELQEKYGSNEEENMLIRGECVSACALLKEKGIFVDLVYIDPPFASGADYAKKVYVRQNPKVAGKMRQAEQELDIDDLKVFEEKMYGDIWDKEKYLNWMYENLMAIKSVMSENATIYVHLDWHIGHYVKILLDEIFGEDKFVNEITWYYYNKMAPKSACFPRTSDKILVYTKSSEYIFHTQYEPRESTKKQLVRKFVDGKAINARDENGNVMYTESTERRVDDVWRIDEIYEDIFGGYAVYIDKFVSDRVSSKIADFNNKLLMTATEKKPYKPITISEEGLELIEFLSLDCTADDGVWHSDVEIKIDKLGYVILNGQKTDDFWDARICCREKPLRLKIRNICGDESIIVL